MTPSPSPFSQWLKERLQRTGRSQNQLARETGYDRSNVTRFLSGERTPTPAFLARSLFALWQWEAFDHPAQAIDGAALLGFSPDQVIRLAEEILPKSADRDAFLTFLKGWNRPFADPLAQGISLPETYVERPALLQRLRALLTAPPQPGVRKRIFLWGMGGIGKTFLARALALDPLLRPTFRHGVLWASLTDAPPDHWLREWARLLQLPTPKDEPLPSLRQRLAHALQPPYLRFLLVLDDAWETEPVEMLLLENPASAVLITARDRSLAQKLRTDDFIVEVGGMEDAEAEELIRRRMGAAWHETDRPYAAELIRRTDHLPLALEIGAAVAKKYGWPALLHRLCREEEALSSLSLSRPQRQEHSLRLVLDISYDNLTPQEQALFEGLGLLAPGAPFALLDVLYAWPFHSLLQAALHPGRDEERATREHFLGLIDASLVTEEIPTYRYRLHPLVALYAQEKARQRGDIALLHQELIQHGLDILTRGTSRGPGAWVLPPAGQKRFLDHHWPQAQRAWQEARKRWRDPLPVDDGVGIAERGLSWADLFGRMGCQALARRRDWESVVQWAQEALALYQEAYRTAWDGEPGGESWNILMTWLLDGLLHLGRREEAATVLERLQREDFGSRTTAWNLRLRVREARLRMLSGEATPGALWRIADRIVHDADQLAGDISELAFHARVEAFLLRGDAAAEYGRPAEAEQFWWLAAQALAPLLPFPGEYGLDEWTLEEVAEKVACLRADRGLWREAARAAAAWGALRRYLGEDPVRPLTATGTWALLGGDEETVEWALGELERVGTKMAERSGRILRGLLLARRGQREEALSLLRAARARYAADPEGDEVARYLEQAVAEVEAGRPVPLWRVKGAPYDVPCDWLSFYLGSFEDWLEEWLRRATKEQKRQSPKESWEDLMRV